MAVDSSTGLYAHVPFCVRKCAYCAFCSEALAGDDAGTRRVDAYLDALERECDGLPSDFAPATLFIGGGTPTCLDPPQLARLLRLLGARRGAAPWRESSCEANPGTVTESKLALLREAGIHRLSLGAQSFQPRLLKRLGRIHSADDTRTAVALARRAGFDNLGLDLIYAVPGSTRRDLDLDLDALLDLAPEHVSAYGLELEPGTPLARAVEEKRLRATSDLAARRQYNRVRERLAAAGYRQYEISNFALPGRASQHNTLYWTGGEYLGVGPAAHSHWHGRRYWNTGDLQEYRRRLAAGESPVVGEETLPPAEKAAETLVFGLRRLDGVDRLWFRKKTGFELPAFREAEIDRLTREGLLTWRDDCLCLTEQALFISDTVFAALI